MRKFRLAAAAAGLLALLVLTAGPAGGGISSVSVSGAFACNTTTGNFDITWTITKINNPSSPTSITSATQNPGGALTPTPNPIPAGAGNTATATSSLPGTTVGPVTLSVVATGNPVPVVGTITLDGTCSIAAAPVVTRPRLTG